MSEMKSEENGAGSLTLKENVIKGHTGLDSLPDCAVAVFEKLPKGGESFFKLLQPGERFRIPFWVSAQKYFAVAVNQSFLSYSFEEEVTMDDGIHTFTLMFHLKYKVANPQRVAELREQDPLRKLRNEIAHVIGRSCARRRWEMVKDRFRDLEVLVMESEKGRLRQYATALGLDISSIELDKRLPREALETKEAREKAEREQERLEIDRRLHDIKEQIERARAHELSLQDIEYKFRVRATELDKELELKGRENALHRAAQESEIGDVGHHYTKRGAELDEQLKLKEKEDAAQIAKLNRELREKQAEAAGTIYTGVASSINTPAEAVEAVESARHIHRILQAGNDASHAPAEIAGPAAAAGYLPAPGADTLAGLLSQAMTQIEQWGGTYAQKQALRSAIMHIVAEVQLDDHADKEALRQHGDKLAELGRTLELSPTQFRLLEKFRNYEQLRGYLK